MIHNGPKRTIFANGEFELLQMVLEPNTKRCASTDAGPQEGWRGEQGIPTRNEALLTRVWKHLPNRCVLKLRD